MRNKKKILNTPRLVELRRKRRRVLLEKVALVVFIVVAVVFVLTFLSRIKKFNISSVEVTGNKVVDVEQIKTIANQNLEGKYLGLLPKTNFVLYPKNKIKDELSNTFKRLKNISIGVNSLNILEIKVDERAGLYTWCGNTLPEVSSSIQEKCYFMDETGYIFDEAPFFSGGVYLKFYGQIQNDFAQIITFKTNIEKMGLKPEVIYFNTDGDMEILLAPSANANRPKVQLKADADLEKVAENLQAALSTEPLLTSFKTKYSSLIYIDLRYGNKVYYKFE